MKGDEGREFGRGGGRRETTTAKKRRRRFGHIGVGLSPGRVLYILATSSGKPLSFSLSNTHTHTRTH